MRSIHVLGPGCGKCLKLQENVRLAAAELQLDCHIEKVAELSRIMAFGVTTTPALVVDGVVLFAGRVPDVAAIKSLLQNQGGECE